MGGHGVETSGHGASCDGCAFRNNTLMNVSQGFRIDVPSGDPFPTVSTIGNNVLYQVTSPYIENGSATITNSVIESNNVITSTNPIKVALPRPTAAAWIGKAIGAATPSTPYFELANGSPAANIGNNTACAWTPSGGQCDAGAYDFTTGAASQSTLHVRTDGSDTACNGNANAGS